MEDISIHFLQAKHRGGCPLLDISKALPSNQATVSNLLTWSISRTEGKYSDMLLSLGWAGSGLQIRQKTLIPIILWWQEGMCSDTVYQNKNTETQKQPRKEARDKAGIVIAHHLYHGHRGMFEETIHCCMLYMKSIKDGVHGKPELSTTPSKTRCMMTTNPLQVFGMFKDVGVDCENHGCHCVQVV